MRNIHHLIHSFSDRMQLFFFFQETKQESSATRGKSTRICFQPNVQPDVLTQKLMLTMNLQNTVTRG